MTRPLLSLLAVLASGVAFGFGLALSTMVQPEVVLSFLRWQDAGLMLVMGGALAVTAPVYRWAPRLWPRPLWGASFGRHVATLDRDTLVGAAIFGTGWGVCGVCPGPAIAGLGTGNLDLLWALGGMLAGAWLHGRTARVPPAPASLVA